MRKPAPALLSLERASPSLVLRLVLRLVPSSGTVTGAVVLLWWCCGGAGGQNGGLAVSAR